MGDVYYESYYEDGFDYDEYEGEDGTDDLFEPEEDIGTLSSPVQYGTTFPQLLETCIVPTFRSIMGQIMYICAASLFFTIVTSIFRVPNQLFHCLSFLTGFYGLFHLVGPSALNTLVISVVFYYLLKFASWRFPQTSYYATLYFSLIYLVLREYFPGRILNEPWEAVRGIQMIMVLKLISISYDLWNLSRKTSPGLLEYLGYMFCPGTVLFGPWIPFSFYEKLLCSAKSGFFETVNRGLKVCSLMVYAFFSLGFSSCFVYWIFLGTTFRWMLAIRDALSVRCSHYFISKMAEALCVSVGFYSSVNESENLKVTDPFKIEFPRSLVEVVVNWNIPMHKWLKIHIFKHFYTPLGPFTTIMLTFFVSSLLHGLNISLSLVLLSLGCYTYVEQYVRNKVAEIFSACVRSRSCSLDCSHTYKSNHHLVILTNFVFSLITYFHLAYLGVMMSHKYSDDASKFSMKSLNEVINRFEPWSRLNYLSHLIVLVTYLSFILV